VTSGVGERVNGDQRVAAESGAWSSSAISSSSEERERLEVIRTPAARMVDDSVVVLQIWTNQRRHDVRLRERKSLGEGGVRGLIGGRRIWAETSAYTRGLRREIRAAWGHDLQRNEAGYGEEREGVL
jgi:hypothetical protein